MEGVLEEDEEGINDQILVRMCQSEVGIRESTFSKMNVTGANKAPTN